MVQFAYEKAQALIQDHQNLRLSRADHDMLLAARDVGKSTPSEPSFERLNEFA